MKLCGLVAVLVMWGALGARAGDGVVALQTADPSCRVGGGFYRDCGNGTVTDLRTGLVWLRDANCFGTRTWHEAMAAVAGLSDLDCEEDEPNCDCGLEDGSSPGEWRLPSRKEWKAMVADAVSPGNCTDPALTGDLGAPCWSPGCVGTGQCSFINVQSSFYWSSSIDLSLSQWVFVQDLDDGSLGSIYRENMSFGTVVWPVRGGQ